MKTLHRYVDESPSLIADREAEERAHQETERALRDRLLWDVWYLQCWTVTVPIRFSEGTYR